MLECIAAVEHDGSESRIPKEFVALHPSEQKLLVFLRTLRYGTVQRLVVRDGLPAFAEEVTKTIKFD